ncbi:MAG: UDP-galactose-4-epimerase [Methanosaeta sp. PtaU1.Bin112]|nr:MAG: UDP-galactose-4-epimerase [Methanosaeta sp. PtaU1.Bin112]
MSEKIVITGGAGFIGSNLAECLSRDNDVLVIDDLSTGKMENLAGMDVRFLRGDLTDQGLLKEAFAGARCVFHQAAIASVKKSVENPMRTNAVGIDGTLNVLIAARDAGVDRVVQASSAAVYGSSPNLPKKEDMLAEPMSPYAVSKLTAEHYARVFLELYGLKTVSLRYFNVFGPKQDPSSEYSGVISRFISALLRDEQPVIYGDGEQTRDFVYVNDVVSANILASRAAPGIYNIASARSISLNTLIEVIGKILGKEVVARHEPARAGDIRHSLADISRAKCMGYIPRFDLEDALLETIEWFKKQ